MIIDKIQNGYTVNFKVNYNFLPNNIKDKIQVGRNSNTEKCEIGRVSKKLMLELGELQKIDPITECAQAILYGACNFAVCHGEVLIEDCIDEYVFYTYMVIRDENNT